MKLSRDGIRNVNWICVTYRTAMNRECDCKQSKNVGIADAWLESDRSRPEAKRMRFISLDMYDSDSIMNNEVGI